MPELPRDRADRAVVAGLRAAGVAASRASVQRWMALGRVLADGVPCAPADKLALGARIEVRPDAGAPTDVVPDPSIELAVVFEDAALLVIDKPAGLVVHPAKGHWQGTLVHGLVARPGFALEAAAEEGGALRPGVVHRLDKGTSGLLVVAKTAAAREGLKQQFAAHTIDREYIAIVVGQAHDATIDAPHGRHPTDRLRFTSLGQPVAPRRAVTHVRVLEALAGATLVVCTLETGRTHQIRVHLAERMRTPILADPLYGKRPKDLLVAQVADQLGRPALHARRLGFTHPLSGERLCFESPAPPDFARALAALAARPTRPSTSRGPST